MSQHSRIKHEKKLARRRKLAEKEKHQQARAVYPHFEIEYEDTTPAEFKTLIKAAVAKINFEDRGLFATDEAAFYRAVKKKGHKAAAEEFRHPGTGGKGSREPGPSTWPRKLGQVVFNAIPREHLLRFVPYHDFYIHPRLQRIWVSIRSLVRVDDEDGPFYHSKRRPTVTVEGERKVVCFSKHAVDQMCKRLVPGGWLTYDGMGEVFAYLNQCEEFEVVRLHHNQTGFTFYDDCAVGFWSRRIAQEVLGSKYETEGDYSYRVGYCPAVIHGDFLLGKTLLYPGYGNTPEYGMILSSCLRQEERARLIGAVKDLDIHQVVRSGDFAILKWFHEHGVPQVIPRKTRYADL